MIKFGLIGCGHWGKNYIRVLKELDTSYLLACCDSSEQKLQDLRLIHKDLDFFTDYRKILENKDIETIVVATPPSSHYSIVKDCLKSGKHVIAEKPLTLKVDECQTLFDLANKKGLQLLVGYTFLYNTAIQKLKNYIEDGSLGKVYYFHSTRTHLGLVRQDINAVWDLAPHDISIFLYLLNEVPKAVSATGACYLQKGKEDVAFISLQFDSGIIGNIHISWVNSNKVREVQIIGENARIIFDDLNNFEKVRIFKKRIERTPDNLTFSEFQNKNTSSFAEFQYILRDGDIISPYINLSEPLKEQSRFFIRCIKENTSLYEQEQMNITITKVMCSITESLLKGGALVEIF